MTIDDIISYVTGGNTTFTLYSTKIEKRYTYKIKVSRKNENLFYVYVLYGQDNCNDYRFIGYFYRDNFILRQSKFKTDDPDVIFSTDIRFRMIEDFLQILCTEDELPETCLFYPSGRCARCGRMLTTPESIQTGFGPECIKYMY